MARNSCEARSNEAGAIGRFALVWSLGLQIGTRALMEHLLLRYFIVL
jgi:hypothetical protein